MYLIPITIQTEKLEHVSALCMCMCACLCVCLCAYVHVYVCVHVCVCECAHVDGLEFSPDSEKTYYSSVLTKSPSPPKNSDYFFRIAVLRSFPKPPWFRVGSPVFVLATQELLYT